MIEVLRSRRSIRKYENKPIEKDKLDILKEAILRSPSSRGNQPWHFIFIEDKSLIEKLAQSKDHGSNFLKGASLAILFCADERKSDVWIEDCSIATTIAHLTAQSLGLGSCWIQIRKRMHDSDITAEEYIATLLSLPDYLKVETILAAGYPAEEKRATPRESLDYSRISINGFERIS
ncbi:MAG: nitroreductase family protein [Deltaproteobacteria bacterium]|nr:nitroreductase family protein [Deltaproteobacteria bacterium]